jgi:hypothetical protein
MALDSHGEEKTCRPRMSYFSELADRVCGVGKSSSRRRFKYADRRKGGDGRTGRGDGFLLSPSRRQTLGRARRKD